MENVQTNQSASIGKPTRPVFLTVLCILTFIGSGWGILSGITGYFTANATAEITQAAMDDASEKIESEAGKTVQLAQKMIAETGDLLQPENLKRNALFSVVAAIFTLLGAILMFGLKKSGFYAYLVGTAIGIAAPFIIFGAGNFLSILSTAFMAFFGILFVVLYGLNFKYLR